MARAFQELFSIFSAAVANSTGAVLEVDDFRHLILHLASSGNASFTIKIQGSIQEAKPDFSAASSPANAWDYLQIKKLADASTVNGATGVAPAGTDVSSLYEVNTNGFKWLCATISGYSAGNVYLFAKSYNDAI